MRYVGLKGRIGRFEDDGSLAILDVDSRGSLSDFLAAGESLAQLEDARVGSRSDPLDLVPAPIVGPGSTIYGIGLNYLSKQEATGRETPEYPTLFIKSTAALGLPGAAVALPEAAPDCVDYEGEIAVVLGAPLLGASTKQAAAAIAAVVPANDVTARDVMRNTGNPTLAKSFPGFAQFGSAVLDPRAYGGIGSLELSTSVNGEVRQRDTGAGMLIDAAELLCLLSRYVQIRPGDVVLTGTPAGTGEETNRYLRAGDLVEVSVGDLPPLRSTIAARRSRLAVSADPKELHA